MSGNGSKAKDLMELNIFAANLTPSAKNETAGNLGEKKNAVILT